MSVSQPVAQRVSAGPSQSQAGATEAAAAAATTANIDLKRTPTDDDINYVWQKVRTCLARGSGQPAAASTRPPVVVPRVFDATEPTGLLRLQARTRKFSMDALSSYNRRRQALLQQQAETREAAGAPGARQPEYSRAGPAIVSGANYDERKYTC